MTIDEQFEHAIACIREEWADGEKMERELRYAKTLASKIEIDYDEGPSAIGFTLADGTYWFLVGDGCWDADDPRSDLLATALDALDTAETRTAEAIAALAETRHLLSVAASYKDEPRVGIGLRMHARDCEAVVAKIDAALASSSSPKEAADGSRQG